MTMLIAIIWTLFLICSSNATPIKVDDLCSTIVDTLCVRMVLSEIATKTKDVNRTLNGIEKDIIEKTHPIESVRSYVDWQWSHISPNLPMPYFHSRFSLQNNIDRKFLRSLMKEGHDALLYICRSIDNILREENSFQFETDGLMKKIRSDLCNKMVCDYRSILDVYSHTWWSIHESRHIEYADKKYGMTSSLILSGHSLIVFRLLREWLSRINYVASTLHSQPSIFI